MLANFFDELRGRGLGTMIGLILGGLITWGFTHWRRIKDRRSIQRGDARDTIVINQHIVESVSEPSGGETRKKAGVLRIRALGQGELKQVVPNGHLAAILQQRAVQVTSSDTLISMKGAEGSYLLETLTGFVCDRTANAPFEHDLYVMAPCCEPQELAHHQPITIILIAVKDLALFESWPLCHNIQVEHGSDGARILTLMVMAQRFKAEQEKLAQLRQAGQRTQHVETMYILDLPLDKRAAPFPIKPVPWGRFEGVLKQINLE